MEKNDPQFVQMLKQEDILWSELRTKYLPQMIVFARNPSRRPADGHMILLCLKVCLANVVLNKDKYTPLDISFSDFVDQALPLLTEDREDLTEERIEIIREHVWGYMRSRMDLMVMMAADYMEVEELGEKVIVDDIESKAEVLYASVLVALLEMTLRKIEIQILEGEFYGDNRE